MQISFSGEASEVFQRVIESLAGLTVEITPDNGCSLHCFDAQLLGIDHSSERADTILVRKLDEETGEASGEPISLVASDITVC